VPRRTFLRSDIRRLSFALIAQQLGLTLSEIDAELSTLPRGQALTLADWRAIGARMRGALAAKIAMLQTMHELLDGWTVDGWRRGPLGSASVGCVPTQR
jgi:MerR family transcriptional regulator, redox-sensitive transcriptional activator SoxR